MDQRYYAFFIIVLSFLVIEPIQLLDYHFYIIIPFGNFREALYSEDDFSVLFLFPFSFQDASQLEDQ